ncbi:hypothetical protein TNCV_2536901 [Trichonephila clavipes]|nr:hypothetical protein TNCV_2536901 [Trichonephila clavipes]
MCHEFELSTAEEVPCIGSPLHVKYVDAQTLSRWCDVKVRREIPELRCRPRLLKKVQNCEVRSPITNYSAT